MAGFAARHLFRHEKLLWVMAVLVKRVTMQIRIAGLSECRSGIKRCSISPLGREDEETDKAPSALFFGRRGRARIPNRSMPFMMKGARNAGLSAEPAAPCGM